MSTCTLTALITLCTHIGEREYDVHIFVYTCIPLPQLCHTAPGHAPAMSAFDITEILHSAAPTVFVCFVVFYQRISFF